MVTDESKESKEFVPEKRYSLFGENPDADD